MKRIRLIEDVSKQFDRDEQPDLWEADRFDWIVTIKTILAQPLNPQQGATIEEMRQSIRVLDALEGKQIGDILELEDADYQHLMAKITSFRWVRVDRRFLRFMTIMQQATDTVIDETPEERTNGHAQASRLVH